MPTPSLTDSKLPGRTINSLEDYFRAGLISERTYDKLSDQQIDAIALERIKAADPSKFLTHEELKARLGIKD